MQYTKCSLKAVNSINHEANNRVQRTRHKVSGPLTRDVQRQEIIEKNYGEISTATVTEEKYGKISALLRQK